MNDNDILAATREVFFEEARDMLQLFEQSLLDMEARPGDPEVVNSAFRAAHTIKGSAGMFGFEAVVAFTHEVEGLLDDMRAGELACSEAVIALLLRGRDQMGLLIDLVGQQVPDDVQQTGDALRAELFALRKKPAAAAVAGPGGDAAATAAAATSATGEWHISLQMGLDALRNGLDPASFIRYLGTIGTVQGIETVTLAVPLLADLDAEACHLAFEIRLHTDASRAVIEEVFDFLQDDCDLAILPADAGPQAFEALLARRAPQPPAREAWLAAWQRLAGPDAAPFVERRMQPAAERPDGAAERREPARDVRGGGDEARFIRVRADKLDKLIDMIGELVIASSGAQLVAFEERSPAFAEAAQRIHDFVQEARDGALSLRMVPIGDTFGRFQRVVRDVGKQLGKEVVLTISGGDTELDKSMVEVLADPLMHLVRNAMDHGIEPAEQRLAAGKPAQGHLGLHAYHESGAIVIEVSDDGRGLDRERILAKALAKGLVSADAVLEDDAVYQFIFAPGFSTAEAVTNLSGRGVGMDVVKRNIESLRGQIRIASQPGRGATMQIRLPLTLAIIDGFLTSVGGVSYVLPLELVAECIEVPAECAASERVSGHFDLRGEVLPYLDVARFYEHKPRDGRRSVVVVRDGQQRVGLVVDRLLGEHQTVIKPLARAFEHIRGLAGSTILGSGEVALILDIPALIDSAVRRLTPGAEIPSPTTSSSQR